MRKFTEDMRYEWIKDEGYYVSREKEIDGTVRVIEGKLYYAEADILYSDKEIYDPCTNITSNSEKVIVWRELESL